MNCIIDDIIPAPPPKPFIRNDYSDRRLTACYTRDGKEYYIECSYSPCRTKCHFSNDELGEAIFNRQTEAFIAATKILDSDYFSFLKRKMGQWKKQFPEF